MNLQQSGETSGQIVALLSGLTGAIGALSAAIFTVRSAQLKSIKESLEAAEHQLESERKENARLRTLNIELEKQIDAQRTRIAAAETTRDEECKLCGRAGGRLTRDNAERLESIACTLASLQSDLALSEQRSHELATEIETLRGDLDSALRENNKLAGQLQADTARAEAQIQALKNELTRQYEAAYKDTGNQSMT